MAVERDISEMDFNAILSDINLIVMLICSLKNNSFQLTISDDVERSSSEQFHKTVNTFTY